MRFIFTLIATLCLFETYAQSIDYGRLLVEAINTASSSERTDLIKKSFSDQALETPGVEALEGIVKRWHEEYSPLAYHHSETNEFKKSTGSVYVMHVYARKVDDTMYKDFQIYLDPNSPHKLEKIAFIAEVAEPVNLPNGSIDQPATLDWLTTYAEKLKTENDLFGSYQIIQGNRVLFDKQFGFENLEQQVPITKQTRFNMASGGKMFTAVAIAQLVEGRKLSFDDPITHYLKGFPDKAKANQVKIRHLLAHTSGVAEYWNGQTDAAVLSATTIDQHLRLVYAAGFEEEAGKAYRYCNSNFILLGAILEKVTGQSYYDYVAKNIFERAGMQHSGYYNHGSQQVAIAYARDGATGWKEGRHGKKGSSAGGAYATVEDVLKFSKALLNNTLIRRETLTTLTTVQNDGLDADEDYGFGFMISRLGGEPAYGHGGTSDGVNFEYRYFTRQDVTLILFCNQNNGAYDDLKKNMIKLISGHR